jgi:tetratricopeptide (TPR) repeat protein
MRGRNNSWCSRLVLLSLAAIAAVPAFAQETQPPPDDLPMYGGMDRSAVPGLKDADEKFIADATALLGSREKASSAWAEQGFIYYHRNKLETAMRRFNQAWLLNPSNPEVFAGFASVLSDWGKNCEAQKILDVGFPIRGPIPDWFLPDAAVIYTVCAVQDPDLSASAKQRLLQKADALLARALASPAPKSYTLTRWASSLYIRGDYAGSWAKVAEHKKVTGEDMEPEFVQKLRAKMPEPAH